MIDLQDVMDSVINEIPFDVDTEIVIIDMAINSYGIEVTYKKYDTQKEYKKEFDTVVELEEWLENGDDEDEQ